MIAKQALEKFMDGALGKIYPLALIEQLEAMREQCSARELNQTAHFDYEAQDGDTVLSVTLTLKVKGDDDEED